MVVTVVLSGMPQYVTLNCVAFNLDKLFDTDEIGTFKVRDLPDTEKGKRRIALDFRNGYDAMSAQRILDSKPYTLPDGVLKVLRARVTTEPSLIARRSPTPEIVRRRLPSTSSSNDDTPVLKMSTKQLKKANEKMNAQLEALEKKKAIVQIDHDLLKQQAKLMRQLRKLDKKAKSKDKEKKKRKKMSKKRSRSISDDDKSGTDSSKRRRTGSSSRETRDSSPTNNRKSFSSDVKMSTPRNRDSSSDRTISSLCEIESTTRKIRDLRNKIKDKELQRLKKYAVTSSDEAYDKERRLRSPKPRNRYGNSSMESQRYGFSSKSSRRSPSRFRDSGYGHSKEMDRYRRSSEREDRAYERSYSGRDSEMRSPKERVCVERHSRNYDDKYASSVVLYRRSPRYNDYHSSSHRNTQYKPESYSRLISEMNDRYQKQEKVRARKEDEALTIKLETELINAKIDDAVKYILKENFTVINEMATKHRVIDVEKKKVLPLLFSIVRDRFKTFSICSDLPVMTMVDRYRCIYPIRLEDHLVSNLFEDIISARDRAKDADDSEQCEIEDMLQQLEMLANDVQFEEDDQESKINEKEITHGNTEPLFQQNQEYVERMVWKEHIANKYQMQEPAETKNVKIKIDEERRKKYYITIRILLKRLRIYIERYKHYIEYPILEYVIRIVLEERINRILVNKMEKMKAKALYAFYRKFYPQSDDEEFIRQMFYNTWHGAYNNIEDATVGNKDGNAPKGGNIASTIDNQADGIAVKTEPATEEPSVDAPNVGTVRKPLPNTSQSSGGTKTVSIKVESVPMEHASVSQIKSNKDKDDSNVLDVANRLANEVTIKNEPAVTRKENDKLISIETSVDKPQTVTKIDTSKVLTIKREHDLIMQNNHKVTAKVATSETPIPAVKMEVADNSDISKTSATKRVVSNVIETGKANANQTKVKLEPITENSKSNDTPLAKDGAKQTAVAGDKSSVASKPAISMPLPKHVKLEVKTEIDDDDDILFMGEYKEGNIDAVKTESDQPIAKACSKDDDVLVLESNLDVIDLSDTEDRKESSTEDVLQINVSNEGEFECAGVGLSQNLNQDFTIDISPNKTTTAAPSTAIENNKSAQTGNVSSVGEVICLSDNEHESIEVSDDEDPQENDTNKKSFTAIASLENTIEGQCTTAEQILTDNFDTSSLEAVMLDDKVDAIVGPQTIPKLEQIVDEVALRNEIIKIADMKVGRTNFSPIRDHKPGASDTQTEKPKDKDHNEEISKTCAERNGNFFDEDTDETIESIQNFLNMI